MANLLWGKVYYKDMFAGTLREEPGGRATFTYDSSYIDGGYPAIAPRCLSTNKPKSRQPDGYGLTITNALIWA